MSKIAVVYWSGTGNTEQMAGFVTDGAKSAGAEVLEESEFEPMFEDCKPKLAGKKIALFGSYDWGDGEWMRNWEATCKEHGAVMVCDFIICNLAPGTEAESSCNAMGSALV